MKKLERLSFSSIWADVNKYILVTTTDRFLLSFLDNYKSTELGFLLEVLPTIFTVSSLQSTAVWFCRCSMTLLKFFLIKNEKCTHVLWIKGLFGKLHARTKHKTSHSHSNSVSTTILQNLVIRHVTRLCLCMITSIIIKITCVISMWTPHWITVSCHGVEGPMTSGYYCAIFPFCGGGKKKKTKNKSILWLGYHRCPSN